MNTLTITLDDETYSRIVARAEAAGVAPEEFVAALAKESVMEVDSVDFAAMARRHMGRYPTVFRRLAE